MAEHMDEDASLTLTTLTQSIKVCTALLGWMRTLKILFQLCMYAFDFKCKCESMIGMLLLTTTSEL